MVDFNIRSSLKEEKICDFERGFLMIGAQGSLVVISVEIKDDYSGIYILISEKDFSKYSLKIVVDRANAVAFVHYARKKPKEQLFFRWLKQSVQDVMRLSVRIAHQQLHPKGNYSKVTVHKNATTKKGIFETSAGQNYITLTDRLYIMMTQWPNTQDK